MKSPDDIKRALNLCNEGKSCLMCPFKGMPYCRDFLHDSVAKYIQKLEAAPKWIDMTIYPPKKGEIGFAYAPEEGWIQLVKVIEATPYKLDVEAIYPKHGIPCIGRYWMPLRFPEPPEEEA